MLAKNGESSFPKSHRKSFFESRHPITNTSVRREVFLLFEDGTHSDHFHLASLGFNPSLPKIACERIALRMLPAVQVLAYPKKRGRSVRRGTIAGPSHVQAATPWGVDVDHVQPESAIE
jgi:hypothetical protein